MKHGQPLLYLAAVLPLLPVWVLLPLRHKENGLVLRLPVLLFTLPVHDWYPGLPLKHKLQAMQNTRVRRGSHIHSLVLVFGLFVPPLPSIAPLLELL